MARPAKFRFRRQHNIGAADAEDDKLFLSNCFVDKGDLAILRNCSDPRTLVLGRTGTGKTALLLKLAEIEERTINIKPESLSLSYISNSTIITFLSNLGINLDVFYKLLWRHVFAVEIIKLHFGITSDQSLKSFKQKFRNLFMGRKERNAIRYLERWGSTFWEATEYRIREITRQFENEVKSNVRSKLPGFSFSADVLAKMTEQEKVEVLHRAQYVLNNVQVRQLSDIIDLLDAILSDRQKLYFLTIDRLDEGWIEEKLRYKLIRALIETAKEFGRVKSAKVIVSIRQDLLDRVFRLVRDPGYQEEKYKSIYLRLDWPKKRLTEVLDTRINYLIQQKYTTQKVTHRDVLPKKVDNEPIVDFIVERTMMQPRDIIHLFNKCIEQARGEPQIKQRMIKQAEGEYSRDRLRYLADEWNADYPNLANFALILKKKNPRFRIGDLSDKDCEEFCLDFCVSDDIQAGYFLNLATHLVNTQLSPSDFRKSIFPIFYKMGLVGLKIESYEKYVWTTFSPRNISSAEISDNTRIAVHPAFWRVLGIRKT